VPSGQPLSPLGAHVHIPRTRLDLRRIDEWPSSLDIQRLPISQLTRVLESDRMGEFRQSANVFGVSGRELLTRVTPDLARSVGSSALPVQTHSVKVFADAFQSLIVSVGRSFEQTTGLMSQQDRISK